mgnify:CR=1 FL=1
MRALKLQAENINFDAKYLTGKSIGSGQYSTVYQCQNKDSLEIVAMKNIYKSKFDTK